MENMVSVIIPVYNTDERLLRVCLESVTAQTYRNLEIILVDDGSADSTRQLCDELAAVDDRIRVIHQKNQGVSTARNNGTLSAKGDYIMYVDSDDIVAEYAIEEAVSALTDRNADFVFAALRIVDSQSAFDVGGKQQSPEIEVFSAEQIDYVKHAFITQREARFRNIAGGGQINRGPYARLIRASVAQKTLFDPRLVVGEDVEWNMRILSSCNTVCFVHSIWYGYAQYTTSALHKYYGNRAELLERYHTALYANNEAFFRKNPDDYAINMAVSFMLMVRTDYLSPQCPLSEKEKRKTIRGLLKKEPWEILTRKERQQALSRRYKTFINACDRGYGLFLFRIWEKYFH